MAEHQTFTEDQQREMDEISVITRRNNNNIVVVSNQNEPSLYNQPISLTLPQE